MIPVTVHEVGLERSYDSLLDSCKHSNGGQPMARVIFHDPFVDKEPVSTISIEPSKDSSPAPIPRPARAEPAAPKPRTLPPQGHEREVQRLIYDLAVLAAKQDPPAS